MNVNRVAEDSETVAARAIWNLLQKTKRLEQQMEGWGDPEGGSPFSEDRELAPKVDIRLPLKFLLSGGSGCLLSLETWLQASEDGGVLHVTAGLYGGYSLLRNSLEYSAAALWIMQPESSRGRVERFLLHELADARFAGSFFKELIRADYPDHLADFTEDLTATEKKIERVREYASSSGISLKYDTKKGLRDKELPSMTTMLTEIEPYRRGFSSYDLTWLASWQLSSGFAHGKWWGRLLSVVAPA